MNSAYQHNTGFTLIELIVVIVIIAILATLAVSRWPGVEINLNAQAQQLASDVRYTQSLSMSRGQRYRLNFPSTSTYTITDINGNILPSAITGNNTTTFNTGIVVTLPPSNLPNNLIAFDGNGVPYIDASATTTLSSSATILLTAGASTKTVQINPQTGRVIVQ